jgi:hypothetical protein
MMLTAENALFKVNNIMLSADNIIMLSIDKEVFSGCYQLTTHEMSSTNNILCYQMITRLYVITCNQLFFFFKTSPTRLPILFKCLVLPVKKL